MFFIFLTLEHPTEKEHSSKKSDTLTTKNITNETSISEEIQELKKKLSSPIGDYEIGSVSKKSKSLSPFKKALKNDGPCDKNSDITPIKPCISRKMSLTTPAKLLPIPILQSTALSNHLKENKFRKSLEKVSSKD